MVITLEDPLLVLLIGPSGSGKSTFARRHFQNTEVLSSDFCRAMICDDENNQAATNDAFELLHLILAKRMQRKRMTVVDATNVQKFARESLYAVAKHFQVRSAALVFALPMDLCQLRNRQRVQRTVPADVLQEQFRLLMESLAQLPNEGFHPIITFRTEQEAAAASVIRRPSV